MSGDKSKRRPQVFDADDPTVRVTPSTDADAAAATPGGDPDATSDPNNEQQAPTDGAANSTGAPGPIDPANVTIADKFSSGIRWGAFLVSAAVALAVLAAGLWFSRFVSIAVARDDWLGWVAKGFAGLIVLALVALLLREVIGFVRLARLSRIRKLGDQAVADADIKLEQRAIASLKTLYGGRAETKWALSRFRESERHKTQTGELIALADTVLMAPSDNAARRVVYESARRVAVVTAVVPIAIITVMFVLFENIRMVRRLAATYGGRPGFLGGVRLLWRVIAYVAASGAIALTDDLFGQFMGQDIIRRLSRRLGEGVFNGALTARLGVAAIEVCRPLPYIKAQPLRARHIISQLFPELSPSQLIGGALRSRRRQTDHDKVFTSRPSSHDQ